ncbi:MULTISPECIES: signal peptidase I [Eubacteriales]|uniref:Signal peptidase I n=2 Tax=Bittarella massiliensis (ex Durand et al. 2017) TaxID=1720313 RepID=A0AAQ1ME54_9FIRM|nr:MULTISPECIES: signal peptidase I [Eubacteriales]ERJ00805.1 signal peptidase I [Clostridium sp. ATCC 29733]SHG19404.1 signal peptidase I Serine peptidase. MEROPS family S26A [Bittarella massiliensis (ex Durand et al. 2017)]
MLPEEHDEQAMREVAEKKKAVMREVVSWVKVFAVAVALALFIGLVVIVNAQVPTSSMEDTIMPGDRIIALRLAYTFGEPQRGDVAVFYPPDEHRLYVKRVIGIPGDEIEIESGVLYRNGEMVEEPYVKGIPQGDYGPYSVPEGHYFLMGDNRNDSLDARFWSTPYVPKKDMLGKVLFRYYPSISKVE